MDLNMKKIKHFLPCLAELKPKTVWSRSWSFGQHFQARLVITFMERKPCCAAV